MPSAKNVACPKCSRQLAPAGETTLRHDDGREEKFLVYQCDECLVEHDLFGEKTEMALTFALDGRGRPVDPADPEKPLKLEWNPPEDAPAED